jgi:hypothetical protein
MGEPITIDLDIIFYVLLGLFSSGILFTALLFFWVIWRVKRIQIPQNADFFTTMRATPLSVAILLDLLDFTFDIFSIPFAWILLGYLGLQPLRMVTVVEAAIPGTQIIPTLTIAWFIARFSNRIPIDMSNFRPPSN